MNKQLPLAIQLNDDATFADFCWDENALLKAQLENMLQQGSERFLYLWGNEGSGKSHLLQACCKALSSDESAIYLPMALLKEAGPEILEGLESSDLVCIDDIDHMAKDALWEEALFHLYNRIRDNGHSRLILSGQKPLKALGIQLPDLLSRLSWGLVIEVHELSDEAKIKSLKDRALKRGFELSDPVGQFLLKRCARNMHDLYKHLNALDEASLSAQRKLTIPFVKSVLGV